MQRDYVTIFHTSKRDPQNAMHFHIRLREYFRCLFNLAVGKVTDHAIRMTPQKRHF